VKYLFTPEGQVWLVESCQIVDAGAAPRFFENLTYGEYDETEALAVMREHGKPINLAENDLAWGNCVAFSPTAIREEAQVMLDSGMLDYDPNHPDADALKWATGASDEELAVLAEVILGWDDDWWHNYHPAILVACKYGYGESVKKSSE